MYLTLHHIGLHTTNILSYRIYLAFSCLTAYTLSHLILPCLRGGRGLLSQFSLFWFCTPRQ